MADAVVETVVLDGETMVIEGAVVSGDVGGGSVVVRVMVIALAACTPPEYAVTVIVFAPINKGILAMLHVVPLLTAVPDAPELDDHDTDTAEAPPLTVPDKATAVREVLDVYVFTAIDKGVAAVLSCAA